tara:strand:+ start:14538 stop:15719 length:1182 start_codon:yes stop_codon:yes gene_type:complete
MRIFRNSYDLDSYFIADFYVESSTNLRDAAWNIAIGQSVGNPNVRNKWETDELFENHSCFIIDSEERLASIQRGYVKIAYPIKNINWKEDGVSQLLCHLMGGQLDIDIIRACHLVDLTLPAHVEEQFPKPKYGIKGIRDFTGVHGKPLLGGIVKPKTGLSPEALLDIVAQMVEGGVNFIKEDEIMANPEFCTIGQRLPAISDYLQGKNVIYCVCINGDYPYIFDRAKQVADLGGNGIHINFWSGFGTYKAVRELDLPLFMHFQKSGDKILTDSSHRFHIKWTVICKLAGLVGTDFIHAGMWGGYMSEDEGSLTDVLDTLYQYDVMPALSCGMHPGLVSAIESRFGTKWMANCGGSIHGHRDGTKAGALAMSQAISGEHGPEYDWAVKEWGLIQ